MSWTNQEVLDVLGEDAQVCARGIIVNVAETVVVDGMEIDRRRNVLVASLEGNSFTVTEDGLELLEARAAKPQSSTRRKAKQGVELPAPPDPVA